MYGVNKFDVPFPYSVRGDISKASMESWRNRPHLRHVLLFLRYSLRFLWPVAAVYAVGESLMMVGRKKASMAVMSKLTRSLGLKQRA